MTTNQQSTTDDPTEAREEYGRVIHWLRQWGYALQDSDGRKLRSAEEARLGDFYAGQSR